MSMQCPECTKEITAYPCKCGYEPKKLSGATAWRETYRQMAFGQTFDEFGQHLFDTVKTIGGLLAIEQQRVAAIHHGQGYKLKGLVERREALRTTLAAQLPTVPDHDMDLLLARYPWIVTQ